MDELKIKKLIYRSAHRGCKEMDVILGPFAEQKLAALSAEDIEQYEKFIQEDDWDIYAWVSGKLPMPDEYIDGIGKKVTEFNAEYVAR